MLWRTSWRHTCIFTLLKRKAKLVLLYDCHLSENRREEKRVALGFFEGFLPLSTLTKYSKS